MNIAIVGSNKGIGLELVKQFKSGSAKIYAFCRKTSKELLEAAPYRIIENFDVTDTKALSDKLSENMPSKFDIVVHVSGILKEDCDASFEEDLIEQYVVNAIGPIHSYNSFSHLLGKGSKFAVLTSQLGSIKNNLTGGRFGYRMSKAAANMACKNISIEGAKKEVTVLMLHPGYVETDMTGHNAEITSETSAIGLKKIIEEKSLSHTGTFWHVNGKELPW